MLLAPLLVAVATFALAAWVLERRSSGAQRRVAAYVARGVPAVADEEPVTQSSRRWLAATAPSLRRLPGWRRFERTAERADLRLSAVELFWAVVGGSVVLPAVAALAGASAFVVVLLFGLELLGVHVWLAIVADRRRRRFDEQLPELLSEVASALRAGHGFNQALLAISSEAPQPISKEFGRVLNESQLGRPLEDALVDLGRRIGSADLDFVIDAIVVQRQVGGSLAGVFTIVSESVRQRQQHTLKIRSLTAMGRISALTVFVLPFALALVLTLMNHRYLAPLFTTASGRLLVVGSIVMLVTAGAWLRRLVAAAR
jgi:tight adherence protein B